MDHFKSKKSIFLAAAEAPAEEAAPAEAEAVAEAVATTAEAEAGPVLVTAAVEAV